jgi:uncharacterized protein
MTNRAKAPIGAPCWVDLWTSDVEASRRFYSELFGWEAHEPDPTHGGYFMFTRDGVPIAGGMGDMGELPANDTWKPYFATDDIERTVKLASEQGGTTRFPAEPVDDLGIQAVIVGPLGAPIGVWQAGTFPGFTVINEHGAPSFFGLDTRDYPATVAFFRQVFEWDPAEEATDDGHHYAGYLDPETGRALAGIGDEVEKLSSGESAAWAIFWHSDDVDGSLAKAKSLGGSVLTEAKDVGFGRTAELADPSGARFWLRRPKR